jgi:hypothetical protein
MRPNFSLGSSSFIGNTNLLHQLYTHTLDFKGFLFWMHKVVMHQVVSVFRVIELGKFIKIGFLCFGYGICFGFHILCVFAMGFHRVLGLVSVMDIGIQVGHLSSEIACKVNLER